MKTLLTIASFILMLFIIVVIHEFGHLIAAKLFGVYCHEFSFGMGPLLFQKQGKETKYSIRAFPIGGYVAMAGDNDNPIEPTVEANLPPERTLKGINPVKKIIIMYAGIIMNFLLALLIISLMFLHLGYGYTSADSTVVEVMENYPAYNAGIKAGDKITGIKLPDGQSYSISSYDEVSAYMSLYNGGDLILTIDSDGNEKTVTLNPKLEEDGSFKMGVTFNQYQIEEVNLLTCFKYGFLYLVMMGKLIISTLLNLFRGTGLNNISGPVGIYQSTSEVVSMGLLPYVEFIAMISLNVGIFNALPLPVMDGGRVLITICEIIIGKPINKKLEGVIMGVSVAMLFALLIFATFQDIFRLIF